MRRFTCSLLILTMSAVAEARLCHEVLLPMSDGVRLYGWGREAEPSAPRPFLLTVQQYDNTPVRASAARSCRPRTKTR
jgi:hypothetical protein